MAKKADIGSKRLISLAPDAWVQWVTQQSDVVSREVGLETLAAATGEEPETIEEVYEPYLLQIGYLQRTPRGRVPTPAAWKHLGFTPPDSQMTLKI